MAEIVALPRADAIPVASLEHRPVAIQFAGTAEAVQLSLGCPGARQYRREAAAVSAIIASDKVSFAAAEDVLRYHTANVRIDGIVLGDGGQELLDACILIGHLQIYPPSCPRTDDFRENVRWQASGLPIGIGLGHEIEIGPDGRRPDFQSA